MNKQEQDAYEYFLPTYYRLKDLNQPYRDKFDDYDDYYRGYRDDTKYPFAFNYDFNKIIPAIFTMLSEMMENLYRDSDIIIVKPTKSMDIARADRAAGVLNHQFRNMNSVDFQGGSYMIMLAWILSALVFGKGIVKEYWRKEEKVLPKRVEVQRPVFRRHPATGQPVIVGYQPMEYMTEAKQVVYNGPYIENVPVRQFLPDPEYRSIQKMPACGHIYKNSIEWAHDMYLRGIFNENVLVIGTSVSEAQKLTPEQRRDITQKKGGGSVDVEEFLLHNINIEGAYSIEEIENDNHKASNIDFIDMYGKYNLQENRGMQIDVDQGITFKGREYECVCTIGNYEQVVRIEKCRYGLKPFFDIGAHMNIHRYWDIGVVELVKDIQEAYSTLANLRLHNSMMKVNTMIKVLADSDIDPRSLVWKPFGVIPVDDMDEVQLFETPDYTSHTYKEQMEFLDATIQDMTGIYGYGKGVTPERQEHTGTIHALQSVGLARTKLLLMTMNYQGFQPLLRHTMLLNMYNLPSGYEFRLLGKGQEQNFGRVFGSDLKLDYDFEAKYAAMEPALSKFARVQNLIQLAQLWQQDPTVNQYEFKKAILELTDMVHAERFLKDPRQVAKEMQMMEMKQLMPQKMQLESQERMQDAQNQTEVVKALLK